METQSPKYSVELLSEKHLHWFINTAAFNMLMYETDRPELIDIETITSLSRLFMDNKTGWVATCNQEPIGALGSILTPNLFNPKFKTLVEVFWYVLPEYRQTRAGAILLNAFNECASANADEATLSLVTTSDVNIRSMEKRGYKFTEFGFIKKYRKQ